MARVGLYEPCALSLSSQTCREILASGAPLLDVRAPTEFAEGALPASVNLPLLRDDERKQVGTAYRKRGKEAAVALGHSLVSGATRNERVASWIDFVDRRSNALVCCARGGLRSQIAAEWLAEAGRPTQRVRGGFKALRQEALTIVSAAADTRDWLILGGRTGCNKTALLREYADSLDFEAAANHRGSSFGGFATPQPSQITFENRLAVELLGHQLGQLLVEDEGRNLGTLAIPEVMVQRMRRSDVVVVEVAFDLRVTNIAEDYVDQPLAAGEAASDLSRRYRAALARLRKRLGDQRWRQYDALIERGFECADEQVHREWISGLLTTYYDPMYDYQLSKKMDRVRFSGSVGEVRAFLGESGYLASAVTTSASHNSKLRA